ncbi:MFS transporter [Actinoallomurus soli]|uniref:MFS transporter n=1 Tax=Actinoallomurus soli TaxID=2952535 RepID=UPI00209350A4|nr:MFS transporter [Actinoallomurus soli]MCO5974962.1 MFS transporter [Actinoallomurus soli]
MSVETSAPSATGPGQAGRRGRARDFNLLWGGQSISLLGDQVCILALPLAAARELHASNLQIGFLGAATKASYLVLGLPAGVWVAWIGMRRSMLGADVLRGLAVLSLPVAGLFGALTLPHLLLVAFVVGVGSVFFQVAYQSYPPLLTSGPDHLHAANTRLSFSESTALLAGPGLAGMVIAACGAVRALFADAGSYVLSIVTLLAIRHRESTPEKTARRPLWQEVGEGLQFVARHPLLRPIMVCGALYNLGVAMYDSMIAVFAVRHLHIATFALGLTLAAGGAGFPLGSLMARRLASRFGIGPSLIIAGLPSVAGLAIGAAAYGGLSVPMLTAGTFINGIGQGSFAVNAITVRQLATPEPMATRATAIHRFVTWGVLPVGSIIAGTIGDAFGLRAAMVTAAVTATTCMAPLGFSRLRTERVLGEAAR